MATYEWIGSVSGVWSLAGNWNPSGPPTSGDTAIFNQNATSNSCAGFNAASTLLAAMKIYQGYSLGIGTTATPLQVGATILEIGQQVDSGAVGGGPQRVILDVGTNQTSTVIYQTGNTTPDAGLENVRIKGSHSANSFSMLNGVVGLGTNSVSDTGNFQTIAVSGGRLNVGAGMTWQTAAFSSNARGNLFAGGSTTTLTLSGNATVATWGDYLITTITGTGGTLILNHRKSSGASVTTLTTTGMNVDTSGDPRSLTITTHNEGAGSFKQFSTSQVTRTTTTPTNGSSLIRTVSLG